MNMNYDNEYCEADKDWRVNYLKKLQSENIINPRRILANHASRLLLGAGVEFSSDNNKIKDFWIEFSKNNKISEFIYDVVQIGSLDGRVIVSISKIDGKARLVIANPFYTNKIAKFYVEERLAVIYTKPIADDVNITIKEIWDEYKVIRVGFNSETEQEISLDVINEKLDPKDKIEPVWFHNLGVLPVVEFKNKALDPFLYSANNATQSYNYLMFSDDFNVRHLPGLINLGLQTKAEDTAFNITKIVGSFDPNKLKKIKDEEPNGLTGYMLDKVVLNAARYGEKGQTNSNSIIEGNPNLSEYSESIKRDFEMYFEGAGYSTPDQAVMDSATQVLYAKSRDVETTNQKRILYTSKFIELIDKCLVVEGITSEIPINEDDREYSFSIKNNLQVSETDKLANIQQKLALGLASKLDSIMELYGISKEEAKVKLAEIDQEKEKELKIMMEQQKITFDNMPGGSININNNMPTPAADEKPEIEPKGVQ